MRKICVSTSFGDKLFTFYNHRILRKIKKIVYAPFKNHIKRVVSSSEFQYGLNTVPREKKIIVSLTSFPQRFETLPLCLKSLCLQSMKPDKICVYLGTDTVTIPEELLILEKYGIEFIRTNDNLMPHKKYFYAMQSFPNDIIITVDDDSIYSKNLVKMLYRTHKKYPDCIAAVRVHKMIYSKEQELYSYNNWINNYTSCRKPSYNLFATGIGGVLYPPGILPQRAFDTEAIKMYCLKADDIWLKFMQLLNRKKVVAAPLSLFYSPEPYEIKTSQELALNQENVKEYKNDEYIAILRNLYSFDQLVCDVF
ncbi:glycosyltransferase family A protein [Treponema sp.]|uniref:glycosyltransferase family A protein n=1 Tax=Treponema sp. TaxID=166 RepID=UPI003EFBC98B